MGEGQAPFQSPQGRVLPASRSLSWPQTSRLHMVTLSLLPLFVRTLTWCYLILMSAKTLFPSLVTLVGGRGLESELLVGDILPHITEARSHSSSPTSVSHLPSRLLGSDDVTVCFLGLWLQGSCCHPVTTSCWLLVFLTGCHLPMSLHFHVLIWSMCCSSLSLAIFPGASVPPYLFGCYLGTLDPDPPVPTPTWRRVMGRLLRYASFLFMTIDLRGTHCCLVFLLFPKYTYFPIALLFSFSITYPGN